MRLYGWCATALAAASLASAETVTITRTVERVVQTTWASSASIVPSYSGNGTLYQPTGTGVYSSPSLTHSVVPATGAAVPLRLDSIAYVAVAGLAGLVAF